MSLFPDLHKTPNIQHNRYRYSDMTSSPFPGLGEMGVIWLNTHSPRISISLHDASLPHFATVVIRNHMGKLNVFFSNLLYKNYIIYTTHITTINLQYIIEHYLQYIIKILEILTLFLFTYLFIYLFIYLLCFHAQQTDRQKTKQIPKVTSTINWG